jgi:hypothetical protein
MYSYKTKVYKDFEDLKNSQSRLVGAVTILYTTFIKGIQLGVETLREGKLNSSGSNLDFACVFSVSAFFSGSPHPSLLAECYRRNVTSPRPLVLAI